MNEASKQAQKVNYRIKLIALQLVLNANEDLLICGSDEAIKFWQRNSASWKLRQSIQGNFWLQVQALMMNPLRQFLRLCFIDSNTFAFQPNLAWKFMNLIKIWKSQQNKKKSMQKVVYKVQKQRICHLTIFSVLNLNLCQYGRATDDGQYLASCNDYECRIEIRKLEYF